MEIGCFAFLRPHLGDLGATFDDHLRLIGKRVVVFLLVLIELFSLGVTLRSYERISVENRRFRSNGGQLTQNFR